MDKTSTFDNLPDEMKALDRWLLWRAEYIKDKNGNSKITKVPKQSNGDNASSTNYNHFASFETVMQAYQSGGFTGLGFCLVEEDPFVIVDLDECLDSNGKLKGTNERRNQMILDSLDSYTEVSYSGEGLHIVVKADNIAGFNNQKENIEMYSQKRFFCMTGNLYNDSSQMVENKNDVIQYLNENYDTKEFESKKEVVDQPVTHEDTELLKKIRRSKNNKKFSDLYDEGDIQTYHGGDSSEADSGLAHIFAWWSKNIEQIERLMRSSALHREKWDRNETEPGYLKRTIMHALSRTKGGYTPDFKNKNSTNEQTDEDNLEIPKPFIDKDGELYYVKETAKNDNIEREEIYVSRQVPYITKEFHNIEFSQVLYQLEFESRIGTIKETVPALMLQDASKLIELSEKGLSVNTNNRMNMIKYFDSFIRFNSQKIELQKAAERLGNVKNRFIHPNTTEDIEIVTLDEGEKQLLESFQFKGTFQNWKEEVFDEIKDQPKALFMVLASFASILLHDLSVDPFIVEISGSTSKGKTTVLKASSSVWGNTNLISEWNATLVSIERKASFLNSFPLMLDDTRKAKEDVIENIAYQFSGGRSKGRGSLKGTQRENTWSNIMLSTGETKMTDIAKTAGGVASRIISLPGQPLKTDIDMIHRIDEGIENNQGLAGVEFQKAWEADKDELKHEFARFKKLYNEKSKGNEVLGRISTYYAVVHFAGSILKNKLGFDINLQHLYSLYDEMMVENKAIDKPMQFLEEILTELDSDRKSIYYDFEPQYKTKAYFNRDSLFLSIHFVNSFLGLESNLIRNEWMERGITIQSTRKNKKVDSKQVKVKEKNVRVIPLNMEVVSELGFNFQEDKI